MLKTKFFELFQIFHLVRKQVYKIKLPEKWKINNIFYMSLLEQDIIRKRWVNKNNLTKLNASTDRNE